MMVPPLSETTGLAAELIGFLAPKFEEVRQKVKEIIQDKILVGHALFNDLAVSPLPSIYPRLSIHAFPQSHEGLLPHDCIRSRY